MTIERVALLGATLLLLLGGCSGGRILGSSIDAANEFAATHGFEKRVYHAGEFELTGFVRAPARASALTVYIEGDGAAWRALDVPPRDPTPRRLLVLELAAQDNRIPLLYLARPCQFLSDDKLRKCSSAYWTESRYAEEVVAAMDQAISMAMREFGTTRLNLVGYSGGGTVALYLAQRRKDVARLVTIASPLNHKAWTEYHGISALTGSLEPLVAWEDVQQIPQYHLAGEKDSIVPPELMRRMLPSGATLKPIRGFDHECCWVRDWQKLLGETGSLNTAN